MKLFELLRPLDFLRISDRELRLSRWIFPLFFGLLLSAILLTLHYKTDYVLIHDGGYFERILILLGVLPGFYIAALAAVATLGHRQMDKILPSAPTLPFPKRGKMVDMPLTKRQFISMLFAFLTLESMFLFLFLSISLPAKEIFVIFSSFWRSIFLTVFIIIVNVALAQIVFLTMFGLYFLGDRIHRVTDSEADPSDIKS